jgi:hypothetical protein
MMGNIKQGKLPRPPADPLQEALAALKQIPAVERFEKGKDHLRLIIETVLARPYLSAAIEEAALLCGKSLIDAMDLRCEVERASMVKPEVSQTEREIVRVLTDPEIVGRMRGSGRPRVVSEYNPFSEYWMGKK